MFMGRKCLRKRNNLEFLYSHLINFNFLHELRHLSVNRVNGIGKKLEFFILALGRIALGVTDHLSVCMFTIPRVYQLC